MSTVVVNIGAGLQKKGTYAYIGRPGPFGNPYVIGIDGDRDEVIAKYRAWFNAKVQTDPQFRREVESLRGKTLGCFCKPQACHGDVIVEWLEERS